MRLLGIVLLICSMTIQAQPPKGKFKDLKAEDIASLRTKKMTLALDLNDNQAQQVYGLMLQQAQTHLSHRETKENYKKEGKTPTEEERLEFYNKQLDNKIAMQRDMKSILNNEQYDLWRTLTMKQKRKGRDGGKRHNQKRSQRRN